MEQELAAEKQLQSENKAGRAALSSYGGYIGDILGIY